MYFIKTLLTIWKLMFSSDLWWQKYFNLRGFTLPIINKKPGANDGQPIQKYAKKQV
jgi:hypothetical protein